MLGLVSFKGSDEDGREYTSGSGDCGKLVVKRESNSGIAGGCYDGCE